MRSARRSERSRLKPARILPALLLALASAGAVAQTVRCESPDGKVTYANAACPEGTRAVRTLPPPDPPNAADAKAARERARADQQRVQKMERQQQAEEAERVRQRAAEAKKNEKRDAQCRKLAQRVRDAEQALQKSALKSREAAEARLRKAREQHAAECGAS